MPSDIVMQVLVIRPPRPGDDFCESLLRQGWIVRNLPVMKIVPLADSSGLIGARVSRLSDYQKAIFISANAARLGADWICRYQRQLPDTLEIFAVGNATAAVLDARFSDQGRKARVPESALSSEGLLALPEMQNIAGEKVLVFRGQGGRETLRDELQTRGALVDYCELYRRVVDTTCQSAIEDWLVADYRGVVVAHSVELVQGLLTMLSTKYQGAVLAKPLLVPGSRVAAYAREQGFAQVIIAPSALAGDMVESLRHWYTAAQHDLP